MATHTLVVVLGLIVMIQAQQNTTSERHRRLIPYMTFYTASNQQPVSYSFSSTPVQGQLLKQSLNKLQGVEYFHDTKSISPVGFQLPKPYQTTKYSAQYSANRAQFPTNQGRFPVSNVNYPSNQANYASNQAHYPSNQAQYQSDQLQRSKLANNAAIEFLLEQLKELKYPVNPTAEYPLNPVYSAKQRYVTQYPVTAPAFPTTHKNSVYPSSNQVLVKYPVDQAQASEYQANVPEYPDNRVVDYPIIKKQETVSNAVKNVPATPNEDDYYYYDDDGNDDGDFDDQDDDVKPSKVKPGPVRVSGGPEGGTPGKPGIDYPTFDKIPTTDFDCKLQRYKGFFGDPATRCQVWHYCDLNGGQASFLCPNGTIFSQVGLTCDWWFNVRCASTVQLYVLNERLYKYILPATPSFPEDYAGPLVDRYLTLKFQEKMRQKTTKT